MSMYFINDKQIFIIAFYYCSLAGKTGYMQNASNHINISEADVIHALAGFCYVAEFKTVADIFIKILERN